MAQEKILFKKYPNRRLYDTEKSEYVSLNQLEDLIKDGKIVEVVEVKTGEDVTAFTLTQIILEKAKKKNTLLPLPLLHLIIRHGENVLSEFFEKYLEQTVQNYLAYKNAADDQFKKWLEMGQDFSSMAQKTAKNFTNLNPMLNPFSNNFFKNGKDPKDQDE
ncbi:MAG: polyhydroxyalkanoate synthesis regulator DNA-binding domain-containing protein [Deltaproteobacteria bacterium]|nr:polyhydroxyalkanoate synthesis regulator DNA-binding domain-containing protein [Deltaproteobacteria bacterium]MBW2218026.1 polyhydroxyalkanoate synthesis regulator DNA-binding domain-containing protein [Deltaproteobacteria bacterium]